MDLLTPLAGFLVGILVGVAPQTAIGTALLYLAASAPGANKTLIPVEKLLYFFQHESHLQ